MPTTYRRHQQHISSGKSCIADVAPHPYRLEVAGAADTRYDRGAMGAPPGTSGLVGGGVEMHHGERPIDDAVRGLGTPLVIRGAQGSARPRWRL